MYDTNWLEAIDSAYPKVYRALIGMGATAEDAADALQDAVERALTRVDGKSVQRPDAWLFVVAVRRWRTQRWRNRLFVPFERLRTQPVTPPPSENAALLVSELKRLSAREREVIVARYIVGLSQRETADALGIAIGTVAATTSHATAKLRERLEAVHGRSRSETKSIY